MFTIGQNFMLGPDDSVLKLHATEYDPRGANPTRTGWLNGFQNHPFKLTDMSAAKQDIEGFILRSVVPYIRNKVSRDDDLSWRIFEATLRRVKNEQVLTPKLYTFLMKPIRLESQS